MRVFVVKAFGRFQRREKITDAMLCAALDNAGKGTIDAKLGGEVNCASRARARARAEGTGC